MIVKFINSFMNGNKPTYNIMQTLYYSHEALKIVDREPKKEISYMSLRITIALSMFNPINTSGT